MADLDQLGFNFNIAPRRIFTVRDLVSAVRTQLEREYTDVYVEGEISNLRPATSGHLYFTLKDEGAQLRAVMFRTQARLLRFRPEDGLQVIARGRVTVYEDRGELQLMAEYLEPKGAGALQVAFEQLKAKLAAEGLFNRERKKPIPPLPRRIGVVTSARGAAIQDILNILRRRHEAVHVLIWPAQVQGEAAPREVSAGIRYFNRHRNVDVIIVARGGGSLEDLAAFNDEGLARAVAASELPVISAVGHETDVTICDFVADLRAPTPSAAAELVVQSKQEIEDRVANLRDRLGRATRFQLLRTRQQLTELAQHGAFGRMRDAIARRHQRVDDLLFRMRAAEGHAIARLRQHVDEATNRLRYHDPRRLLAESRTILAGQVSEITNLTRALLSRRRAQVSQLTAQLQALSPVAILDRGYALVFDAQGNLVKDAAQLHPADEITAKLARGSIIATVKERKA